MMIITWDVITVAARGRTTSCKLNTMENTALAVVADRLHAIRREERAKSAEATVVVAGGEVTVSAFLRGGKPKWSWKV